MNELTLALGTWTAMAVLGLGATLGFVVIEWRQRCG